MRDSASPRSGVDWPWLARPLYVASAALLILVLELLALDGRMFQLLGFSLQAFQSPTVSNPVLIDTLAAMTLSGLAFYGVAAAIDRRGSELQAVAARLLFTIAPFAVLQPLGYLVRTGEYSLRYDWIYLLLAIATALVSQTRQRRAFYYAGVLNTGGALFWIADHRALVRPAAVGDWQSSSRDCSRWRQDSCSTGDRAARTSRGRRPVRGEHRLCPRKTERKEPTRIPRMIRIRRGGSVRIRHEESGSLGPRGGVRRVAGDAPRSTRRSAALRRADRGASPATRAFGAAGLRTTDPRDPRRLTSQVASSGFLGRAGEHQWTSKASPD